MASKAAGTQGSDPAFVFSGLARAGFGARPGEAEAVARRGFASWAEEQLRPDATPESELQARLAAVRLRIRYKANDKPGEGWPAVDEVRPLQFLDTPISEVWPLADYHRPLENAERRRPADETACATLMRAVHSHWQLREVMAGFWHDHFHVDSYSSDQLAVALPTYDRDVIRPHLFGNFREFLEAVATSTSMQIYLSNASSRAGSANENYARELFELHTLGRDAYLNDRYDRWRTVPGALKGEPVGYIDEDVYEAARALTGWTVENGASIDGHRKLPATGRFTYVESWHDGYQKRVLASEFASFQRPMADGRKMLDLVAFHPATARHLAGKLVRKLVSDDPPPRLLKAAEESWLAARKQPDQIARVLRTILLSPEFAAARGAKVKRPLAVVASFARAAGIEFASSDALQGELGNSGQRLFAYGAPTGLPDERGTFLNSNGMQRRWTLVMALAQNWWQTGELKASAQLASAGFETGVTPRQAVRHWLGRFTGRSEQATEEALLRALKWPPDEPITAPNPAEYEKRLAWLAAYAAMSPEFQVA